MRTIVGDYLDRKLSRRGFMSRMSQAGFSALAVSSALQSLDPLVQAQAAPQGGQPVGGSIIPFQGTGGELLAEQIKAAGAQYVFLANGSGLGPLCDALVDRPEIQIILAVHEGHCVSIADGYAKASGKTGFAMFSRVGTPNASSSMYNAIKDRSPLVITCDHTETNRTGRDGHEDVEDWLETVEQFTKFRWLVHTAERIPEWTMKAFKLSSTMPGGPTYLRFPRDVLYAQDVKAGIFAPRTFDVPMHIGPDPRAVERAARVLLEAASPLLYLGMEVTASGAVSQVVELAELLGFAVTQSRSWADDFPTKHPLFLGGYSGSMRYPGKIDAFVNLGAHMPHPRDWDSEPLRGAKIIHARAETPYLGTAYPVDIALAGSVKETVAALIESIKSLATSERLSRIAAPRLAASQKFVKAMEQSRVAAARRRWDQVPLSWERLSFEINAALDQDAYIVPEFGTQGPKSLQWFSFGEGEKTRIGRTTGYALGWGVGAAIGVKLARPNNQVVSLQGDGGFLFGQIEALWSASRYDVPIIIVIFNNRCYNETRVRMLGRRGRQAQEQKDMLSYLGDPNVDYAQVANAFGIKGEKVSTPDQIQPAMERAVRTTREGRPYLIDALIESSGSGAELQWYPDYSVAESRGRQV